MTEAAEAADKDRLLLIETQGLADGGPYDEGYVYFPICWDYEEEGHKPNDGLGRDPVEDPTTLYACVPIGGGDRQQVLACSLEGALDALIDEAVGEDGKFSAGYAPKIATLRDALRRMADKIDGRLPT